MQTISEDLNSPYSPSFSTYFNPNLADVVARVTTELPAADHDDFPNCQHIQSRYEDDGGDFEFNLSDRAPGDADKILVYPLFDRDLLRDFDLVSEVESRPLISLQNLFLEVEDGGTQSTSSSSEADELGDIPPEMYCFWNPRKSSPGRCRKSNSTGSSATEKVKVWKLRDLLLNRSRSEGKDQGRQPMMLFPAKKKPAAGDVRKSAYPCGEKKRRSYLPYRQNILGLGGLFVSPLAAKSHR